MHFIDEVKITIKAGNGGRGCISFQRAKFIARGKPGGGNGGSGGDVFFCPDSALETLADFRFQKYFSAENGKKGSSNKKQGPSAEPLIIKVPVGTEVLTEDKQNLLLDLTEENCQSKFLSGARGGVGNASYKALTPDSEAILGGVGEEITVWLSLKTLADIAIIGLPNAGKSTILTHLTNSKAQIGDYAFTTIRPNIGSFVHNYQKYTIADIPGLIDGASLGRGLGHRFLKHIERCKMLLHVVGLDQAKPFANYQATRQELTLYGAELSQKPEMLVLHKADQVKPDKLVQIIEEFKQEVSGEIYVTSCLQEPLTALYEPMAKCLQLSEMTQG